MNSSNQTFMPSVTSILKTAFEFALGLPETTNLKSEPVFFDSFDPKVVIKDIESKTSDIPSLDLNKTEILEVAAN